MTTIAAIFSFILITASPPPPPPPAPEIAQGEFDGYDGPALWNAWQRATYDAAASGALEIYEQYNQDQAGATIAIEGPRVERWSPFYWTETLRFAFNQVCDDDVCQWRYHRVTLDREIELYDGVAEALFEGLTAATYLREAGIEPGQDIPTAHRAFGRQAELTSAVSAHIRFHVQYESECSAVADWQERYDAQMTPADPVETENGIPSPPPPPYPINIGVRIDMPGAALGSDEEWVRLEGNRDRALIDLSSALPPPLEVCFGGG